MIVTYYLILNKNNLLNLLSSYGGISTTERKGWH